MEKSGLIMIMAVLSALVLPAYAQLGPQACTPAMINSVAPCMSFLTDSGANITSPTQDCCNSLRSLTAGGTGCLCNIVTGSIPFQVPINRTTAVSLPRECNMPRVPVQCKANIAPGAAPGPASLGPMLSPTASPSPAASVVPGPASSAQPPESGKPPLVVPSSPADAGGAPTSDGGSSRPSLTPSAAFQSYNLSPSLLIFAFGLLALKFY